MNTYSSLTKRQKEAIGLLQVGTFLEYFDLMLYVHMAVLLNQLFFPSTDHHTSNLLSAFAFCSTFIFRPFGAFIFGHLGDNIGRKITVIITTFMMATSCIIMANLPTYEQIGITAAWVVTICRIVQGMSSMGEVVGAELYLSEITKPPIQYPIVAFVSVFATLGTMFALATAAMVTSMGFNWRLAFWIGAGIATIGTAARTHLRETPEFIRAKIRRKKRLSGDEKVNKKSAIALFLIQCAWPVSFYFAYVHCGNILQHSFGYTAQQVINQNLLVSMVHLLGFLIITFLSYKIHPLRILKFKALIFFLGALTCPLLLKIIDSPLSLFMLQSFIVLFSTDNIPAVPIFFKHFPVFKRFFYSSFTYALSRAVMYVVTSFGLVYLTEKFGDWGLLIILLPIVIGFAYGIHHFELLEKLTPINSSVRIEGEQVFPGNKIYS